MQFHEPGGKIELYIFSHAAQKRWTVRAENSFLWTEPEMWFNISGKISIEKPDEY
jgi:hypothetical protein